MISRREFLGTSLAAGASLALTPELLRAFQQSGGKLLQRAIPSSGEMLPVIGVQFEDAELARSLGYAALVVILAEGGLTSIELTMTTPGAIRVLEKATAELPDFIFGLGTVLDPETARRRVVTIEEPDARVYITGMDESTPSRFLVHCVFANAAAMAPLMAPISVFQRDHLFAGV